MNWYYANSPERCGPVDDAQFAALVANGTITGSTLVWRQGMPEWQPYHKVAGAPAAATATAASTPAEDPNTAICAVSGKRYPKSAMLQYEGRWVSAEHRDVFFQRLREGLAPATADAMPGPFGYGGFWRRFAARFIDGIVLGVSSMVITVPLGMGLGAAVASGSSANPAAFIIIQILSSLVGLVIALAYELWLIRKYDATLGKMALGLKLFRADGAKLSRGRIIGRFFANYVSILSLYIGYIIVGFDDEKRSLHDRICDTRVVKTRP